MLRKNSSHTASGETTKILMMPWWLRLAILIRWKANDREFLWSLAVPVAVVMALALSLPSLSMGFVLDDYFMLGFMEGWHDVERPWLNLYTGFLDVPHVAWWISPETEGMNFWRPLSSAVIRLNYALFGREAFFYHVHMLTWLMGLMLVVSHLYRRLSLPVAVLALLFFAVDEGHAQTSGVISNSHTVVSVIPALLGLLAYLRWREEGWRPGRWLSLLGFAVGLLGGETAFAVLAYPLAYELFGASGRLRQRLGAIAPTALLAVTYVGLYKVMGYGPGGATGHYLDPFGDPIGFLTGLARHVPLYLAGVLAALPQLFMLPAWELSYLVVGVTVPLGLFWYWRRFRRQLSVDDRREIRWWVFGALGALLPVVAVPPNERQVLVPALGFAPLLAGLARMSWQAWRNDGKTLSRRRLGAACLLVLLAVLHIGVASTNRVFTLSFFGKMFDTLEEDSRTIADLVDEPNAVSLDTDGRDVVLVTSHFVMSYGGPAVYEAVNGPESISWHSLSAAPFDHRLTRTAQRTLVLELVKGEMLNSKPEKIFRLRGEIASGDTVTTDLFTVEILETNKSGPTKVAYHFERDFDDPGLTFLTWNFDGPRSLDLPEVGESLILREPSEKTPGA